MNKTFFFIPLALFACGCSQKSAQVASTASSTSSADLAQPIPAERPAAFVLKASAFKMSGPYSDNVAITISPQGTMTYFPAPSDISAQSRPVEIGDGWWLNMQGLGPGSVFTSYTFEEYARLSKTPSVDELKKAVIPGARVTAFETLSVSASEAPQRIPELRQELAGRN